MLKIGALRRPLSIIVIGSHRGIVQSMIDFDHLVGREEPSVKAIVATGRKSERYAFGGREILIRVYPDVGSIPVEIRESASLFLNVSSGRRVYSSTSDAMTVLPNLLGSSVFAEGVTEQHAHKLRRLADAHSGWIAGPASVGLIVPGFVKLGAIGGTDANQLVAARLEQPGSVAVVSSSGGMVNEIIRAATGSGHLVSFAVALGGDRFPVLAPAEALLAAEEDSATRAVIYFGELGGKDEYEIAELRKSGALTKPLLCYIAGTAAELFPSPPQFGHAGAMAEHRDESARAKRELLRETGAQAAETFQEFIELIAALPEDTIKAAAATPAIRLTSAAFASSISRDTDSGVQILGQDLLQMAEQRSFGWIVGSMLLGKPLSSNITEEFIEYVLKLLVDHGPYVSGAVNTMVAARAGRDLVSSLSAGLLTIGPRFGGAINEAAATWADGTAQHRNPAEVVEEFAAAKRYISGIGHKVYRSDHPDPRVVRLMRFTEQLKQHPYSDFARGVEAVTTQKKASLILNIDGAIAAVLLDVLTQAEGHTAEQVRELVDIEFFNALFVLSRSVGFVSHYLDQRRLDEGLFRLKPSDVADASQL